MASGVVSAWPDAQVIRRPLSDGGNGLLEAWADQHGGVLEGLDVSGPLGETTPASFLLSDATVVESYCASPPIVILLGWFWVSAGALPWMEAPAWLGPWDGAFWTEQVASWMTAEPPWWI
jgi:hypothetical protein